MPLKTVKDAEEAVKSAVGDINPLALLIIRFTELAWSKLTEKGAFSKEDLIQYNKLCALYKICNQNAALPSQWVLDEENRPQYSATFADLVKGLIDQAVMPQ